MLLAAGLSNADYGDVRLAVNRAGQGWVVWDQTISSSMSSSDPEWVYAVFLNGTTAKTPVIVKAGKTNGEARYRQPRVAIDGTTAVGGRWQARACRRAASDAPSRSPLPLPRRCRTH